MKVIAVSDSRHLAAVRAAAEVRRRSGDRGSRGGVTSMLHFGTAEAEQVHVLAYFPPDFLIGDRLEKTFLYRRGLSRSGEVARVRARVG